MRKALLLVFILIPFYLSAQTTSAKKFTDEDYFRIVKMSIFDSKQEESIEAKEISSIIQDSISLPQHKNLIPYKDFIQKSFYSMYYMNFIQKAFVPEFIKYKGSDCIIFKNISSKSVYNNAKLTDRERAMLIFNEFAIKAISEIGKSSEKAPQYVGVSISYTTKDFTEKYDIGSSENLIIIIPSKVARDFSSLEITEDALIDKADIIFRKSGGALRSMKLHY